MSTTVCYCQRSLTCGFADVQHVADDVLCVQLGLRPGHLDGGGGQGLGLQVGGHARQPVGLEHREASAGLRGAGAVLRNTLVDGLVVLADVIDGQCAVGEEGENETLKFSFFDTWKRVD